MQPHRTKVGIEYPAARIGKIVRIAFFLMTAAAPLAHADQDAVHRGAYLATASDCIACHTVPNGRPFAGGEAIATPFGKIYPPNITPDMETGIGGWTDKEFVRAMWHGIGRRGEHLYPAFPYTDFTKLTERDVLDIRAYLATIPAVHNTTPPNDLIFPLNIRGLMRFWNALFLDDRRFTPDPQRSGAWNRGAYLVTAMAHCGACHTPRNVFQAERSDRTFAGAVSTGWYAPNISSSAVGGIGSWSDEEIRSFLRAGSNRHGTAAGPMAMAVLDSFKNLTEADIDAIIAYLRSVPAQDNADHGILREAPRALAYDRPPTSDLGSMLYQGSCARCHGLDGMGVSANFPAIAVDRAVTGVAATTVVQMILKGADPDKLTGVKRMPAFGDTLSDLQIAALTNAVLDKFGAHAPAVTASTVQSLRETH
jgi:mono/diheme cytochrome c family protein